MMRYCPRFSLRTLKTRLAESGPPMALVSRVIALNAQCRKSGSSRNLELRMRLSNSKTPCTTRDAGACSKFHNSIADNDSAGCGIWTIKCVEEPETKG